MIIVSSDEACENVVFQIERLTQSIATTETEIEKCRLDIDGVSKQESQLKQQLAELESKNPNTTFDVKKKEQLEAVLAKEQTVCHG